MNNHALNVFFRVFIEWNFVSLIILFLHMISSRPMPLGMNMVLAGGAAVVFTLLLQKKGKLGKIGFFTIVLPAILLIGYFAGLQMFYLVSMALFILWRTPHHFDDATSSYESVWLVMTFLIGVFMLPIAYFNGNEYFWQLTFLLIFQLIFIISGQFFLRWIEIEKVDKKMFAADFAAWIGVAFLLVAFISLIKDYLKAIFIFVLTIVGWLISMLMYPLFSWIDSPGIKKMTSRIIVRKPSVKELDPLPVVTEHTFNVELWGPIIFGFIAVILFYFLYKRRIGLNEGEDGILKEPGLTALSLQGKATGRERLFRRNSYTPVNKIRKEVYLLEKYAIKKKMGRHSHETINEWLDRLGIEYGQQTVQVYEQVRYGSFTDLEAGDWFKEEIKSIKNQLSKRKRDKD